MPKKLIICADGTWNTQDEAEGETPCPTNVEKIARALRTEPEGQPVQIVHYESGVGTDWGFRVRGAALGRGLWQNVLDCYRFLVHNFCDDDQLYLFGFSRGAYTARSLVGLIRNSGILKRGKEDLERRAVELYRDYDPKTEPDSDTCKKFRAENCHEPEIEFLGVWDTVGSLGIPGMDGSFRFAKGLDYQFHDVKLSRRVKCARHALAIHETRTSFVPTLWEDSAGDCERLRQVWFSGAHADVGGGYCEHQLSDIALGWMMEEAKKSGLDFGPEPLPGRDPADAHAERHDEFGAASKVLAFLRGQPRGALREFSERKETCEAIHPSVIERYRKNPDPKVWPPSFEEALRRLVQQ
jgi:uncharacterized protein (DUF2235 family)